MAAEVVAAAAKPLGETAKFIIGLIAAGVATIGGAAAVEAIRSIPEREQHNFIKALNKQKKGSGTHAWNLYQRDKLFEDIQTHTDPKKQKVQLQQLDKLDKIIAKGNKKYPGVKSSDINDPANPISGDKTRKGPEGDIWNGYRPYADQLPLLSPEQIRSQNQLLPGVTNQLMNNEQSFEPKAEHLRREYDRNAEPALARRLNFLGVQGPQYANALAAGRADIESNINAQRVDYGQNNRTQQQNLYSTLMNRNFENMYYKGQSGLKKEAISSFIEHGGNMLEEHGPTLLKAGSEKFNNWLNPPQQEQPPYSNDLVKKSALLNYGKQNPTQQLQATQQQKLANNELGGNGRKYKNPQQQLNDAMGLYGR